MELATPATSAATSAVLAAEAAAVASIAAHEHRIIRKVHRALVKLTAWVVDSLAFSVKLETAQQHYLRRALLRWYKRSDLHRLDQLLLHLHELAQPMQPAFARWSSNHAARQLPTPPAFEHAVFHLRSSKRALQVALWRWLSWVGWSARQWSTATAFAGLQRRRSITAAFTRWTSAALWWARRRSSADAHTLHGIGEAFARWVVCARWSSQQRSIAKRQRRRSAAAALAQWMARSQWVARQRPATTLRRRRQTATAMARWSVAAAEAAALRAAALGLQRRLSSAPPPRPSTPASSAFLSTPALQSVHQRGEWTSDVSDWSDRAESPDVWPPRGRTPASGQRAHDGAPLLALRSLPMWAHPTSVAASLAADLAADLGCSPAASAAPSPIAFAGAWIRMHSSIEGCRAWRRWRRWGELRGSSRRLQRHAARERLLHHTHRLLQRWQRRSERSTRRDGLAREGIERRQLARQARAVLTWRARGGFGSFGGFGRAIVDSLRAAAERQQRLGRFERGWAAWRHTHGLRHSAASRLDRACRLHRESATHECMRAIRLAARLHARVRRASRRLCAFEGCPRPSTTFHDLPQTLHRPCTDLAPIFH